MKDLYDLIDDVPPITGISETGLYDLEMDVYHGDCCAGPSISSSGLKQILIDPAVYWDTSALNPAARKVEAKRHFNIGTSAHLFLLEPHLIKEQISVIPSDMLASNGALSTKAAKAFVADQTELGRTVIKEEEWDMVCDMADRLSENETVSRALTDVVVEQSIILKDPNTGVFLKSRPDVMPTQSGRWIVDYKTTDYDDIRAWERQSTADVRLDVQAALQIWAVKEAAGIDPQGVMYVVQSKKPPHRVAIRVIRPGTDLFNMGRVDLRRAINKFHACITTGQWPSEWDKVCDVTPPDFRLRQIERELAEAEWNFLDHIAA